MQPLVNFENFVKENNMTGIMIWEKTQNHFFDRNLKRVSKVDFYSVYFSAELKIQF